MTKRFDSSSQYIAFWRLLMVCSMLRFILMLLVPLKFSYVIKTSTLFSRCSDYTCKHWGFSRVHQNPENNRRTSGNVHLLSAMLLGQREADSDSFNFSPIRDDYRSIEGKERMWSNKQYFSSPTVQFFLEQDTISFKADNDNQSTTSRSSIKPPLLFIPGLDGTGDFSAQSLTNLTADYRCWRMSVSPKDRSTFLQLAEAVIGHVQSLKQPVILVGESFGGLLCCYVSSRLIGTGYIDKLVLINPATNFDLTRWPSVGPLLANTGRAYPLIGASTLLATAVQPKQIVEIGQKIRGRINSWSDARRELDNMWSGFQSLPQNIPPATLTWRLRNWLGVGSFLMDDDSRYESLTGRLLVITGGSDRLLPSGDEGARLKARCSNAAVEVRNFPGRGHAILDGSIDLAQLLRESKTFRISDPNSIERPLPAEWEIANVNATVNRFYQATSPIFLSRSRDSGKLVLGLDDVPTGLSGRPVLLVGNHQLYGLDLPLIITQFLRDKNTLVRGLAHPFIFQQPQQPPGASERRSGATNGLRDTFTTFGAVEVNPMSIYQLLKINATVLLFPGGVREANHGRGENYQLFWPEKTDFVRMAAMMDAIIVPFAAVGMADSVNFLLDEKDYARIPFLKRRVEQMSANMPRARAGVEEKWSAPLIAPRLPDRNYFLFQQPVDTRDLRAGDKAACRIAYEEVRGSVQSAVDTLLKFRERDPNRRFLRRIAYERVFKKQAPTAPLDPEL